MNVLSATKHVEVDMLHKRHKKKRTFVAYVAAPSAQDIAFAIATFNEDHVLQVTNGNGTHFQTIELNIAPSTFRRLQDALPDIVYVSYALKEPEKC